MPRALMVSMLTSIQVLGPHWHTYLYTLTHYDTVSYHLRRNTTSSPELSSL